MKRLLIPIFLLLALALPAYDIVLDSNATSPEKTAASELAEYLPKLSKTPINVYRVYNATEHPAIYVGKTDAALAAFGLSSWDDLQPDEVLYKTTENGDLWIAGEGTRGTIYAVYELLEKEYGVRFLTADIEHVPQSDNFALPKPGTFHRYAPPFISRATGYDLVQLGGYDFAAKRRNNFFYSMSDSWGGYDSIIGFVHTMGSLIDESYYAEHPEWFALRDGVRSTGGQSGQLCLTNQEMRQELISKVKEKLEADGGKSHFISVSQNDNQLYCQCDTCNAFVNANGNQTDLLMDCVNDVADAIRDEYPDVYVDTLAYHYTRQPPKTIMPRDNVAIRYCTIEAASFFPLESTQNDTLYQELAAWKKLGNKMLIWNYVTDFNKYYLVHPNWTAIPQDVRLFRDCNVINIFQQGAYNYGASASDMSDLRVYLISALLWNPDQNLNDLTNEFLRYVYGPGMNYVRNYLDTISKYVAAHPTATDTCYVTNTKSWMSDLELATVWKEFYDGVMTLKDDETYGDRLAVAVLPITMALMEREELLEADPEDRLDPLKDVDEIELVDWCKETLALTNATQLSESSGMTVEYWVNLMRGVYCHELVLPDIPCSYDRPEGFPEDQQFWSYNFEDMNCVTLEGENTCKVMEDANAIGGKAVRMPNTHQQWYLQAKNLPRAVFDVYLTVRCDAKSGTTPTGKVMTFGNYPAGPNGSANAQDIAGSTYKLVYLGNSNLSKADYFYGAPAINSTSEYVWFDRLIVTNPTDTDGNPLTVVEE